MTPEEIQQTMEFILQSQANSVVRMDRVEEKLETLATSTQARIDALTEDVHNLTEITNHLAATTEELVESNRTTKELLSVLVPLVAANSRRIDRLEDRK